MGHGERWPQRLVSVSDVVGLRSVTGPAPIGDAQLDPVQGGGLTALRIADGTKVWFAASTPCGPPRPGCSPAQPGALTVVPGAVFSGSMDGHVRAFSTADGKLLWDSIRRNLSHGQQRARQGSIARWCRPGGGRRHDVRELRLSPLWRSGRNVLLAFGVEAP